MMKTRSYIQVWPKFWVFISFLSSFSCFLHPKQSFSSLPFFPPYPSPNSPPPPFHSLLHCFSSDTSGHPVISAQPCYIKLQWDQACPPSPRLDEVIWHEEWVPKAGNRVTELVISSALTARSLTGRPGYTTVNYVQRPAASPIQVSLLSIHFLWVPLSLN